MESVKARPASKYKLLRWIARVIFIPWALYWAYFFIGEGIFAAEDFTLQPMPLYASFLLAAGLLAVALIAWFLEGIGGILLILFGKALTDRYPMGALVMAIPPIIAGVLLILNYCMNRWLGGGRRRAAAVPTDKDAAV